MGDRQVVLEDVSPDGLWTLTIEGPAKCASAYYANFKSAQGGGMGVPFGYDAPAEHLEATWNLPDSVLGVFLSRECYLLFRWGPRRRRYRELYRLGKGRGFNSAEIEWFCAKRHTQTRLTSGST